MNCTHDYMRTDFDLETRERVTVCGDCGKTMGPEDFAGVTFTIDTAVPEVESAVKLRCDPDNYATVTIRRRPSRT